MKTSIFAILALFAAAQAFAATPPEQMPNASSDVDSAIDSEMQGLPPGLDGDSHGIDTRGGDVTDGGGYTHVNPI